MSTPSNNVTALQKRPDPAASIVSLLERNKGELARAAGKHLSADRVVRLAVTALRSNPELLKCDPVSIVKSVMQATQLGLEVDGVLGRAYLVPYKSRKQIAGQWADHHECQLIVGYRGMIELALRSGMVETVEGYAVYEGDEFEYELGLNRKLRHVPGDDPGRESADKLTHAYAIVRFRNGGVLFSVMTRAALKRAREASPGAFFKDHKTGKLSPKEKSPWHAHFEAMCIKTVIRRVFKFSPAATEMLSQQLAREDSAESRALGEIIDVVPNAPPMEEAPLGEETALEGVDPLTGEVLDDVPISASPPRTTADLKARSRATQNKARAVDEVPEPPQAAERHPGEDG